MENTTHNEDQRQYAHQSSVISKIDRSILLNNFSNMARWYECFLVGNLPAGKNDPILDVPCGHGNFLYFLRQQGYTNVVGVDFDPIRVSIAQSMDLPARQADALDYLRSTFDLSLISSLDFIEHIDKECVPDLISSYYRALRSGGVLIIRTPITDSLLGAYDLYNDFTHKWAGNSGMLTGLLKQAGFSSIIFKDERPVPYKFINWIRLCFFYIAKSLTNFWLFLLGFPARRVWSTSGWYIARKL